MSEWKPIEEAPKDGTTVDILLNGKSRIPDVYFDSGEWLEEGTNVPVLHDPFNKITHFLIPPEPPGDYVDMPEHLRGPGA